MSSISTPPSWQRFSSALKFSTACRSDDISRYVCFCEYPRGPVNASSDTLQRQSGRPAGYAWVIEQYGLDLPRPPQLAGISGRHRPRRTRDALLFPESYAPAASLSAQLTFALKWEGVNLAVLEALFRAVSEAEIAEMVRSAPTGAYMRRIWFLHEWLTGRALDLPDPGKVRAVPVVDPKLQLGLEGGELSTRHRVRNNLPGTPAFCPMVRRTAAISAWQAAALGEQARSVIGRTRADGRFGKHVDTEVGSWLYSGCVPE